MSWSKFRSSQLLFGLLVMLCAELALAASPRAIDDDYNITEDTNVSGNVLNNDFDPDNDLFNLASSTSPSNGTLTMTTGIGATGDFTYVPNPQFSGEDSFTYTLFSLTPTCFLNPAGAQCTDTATVTFLIEAEADPLNLAAGPATGAEDSTIPLNISHVLQDTDGSESVTVSVTGVAPGHTLTAGTDLGGGSWSVPPAALASIGYVPAANENGSFSISVRADVLDEAFDSLGVLINSDSFNESINVAIDVIAVNEPPSVVLPISDIAVDEDGPDLLFTLSNVFADVDIATNGDSLSYTVTYTNSSMFDSASASGGMLTMSLAPDQNGTSTVTVTATDSGGLNTADSFEITVNSINDAPFLANSLADITYVEDGPDFVLPLMSVIDDVDIATNGDILTFSATSSNPSLFDLVDATAGVLTLSLALDQNGVSTITIVATDIAGLSETESFDINVTAQSDTPVANNDVVTMDEDDTFITIPVLANDYPAEGPATIANAGIGGFSESAPTIILDPLGDPIGGSNGTVVINGDDIEYEPKANFYGVDYFTYTIMDSEGDISAPATVTVNVIQVNDPPVGNPTKTYPMIENTVIMINAATGALVNAYDIDANLLDGSGNPVGSPLSAIAKTSPVNGVIDFSNFAIDGSFTYTPAADWTGTDSFTYSLFDGTDESENDYLIRIVVTEAPPAAPPPTPGEVSVTYNLTNTPLEQSTTVPPNVMVLMDDSGSMDWNLIVSGLDENGGFQLDNSAIATRSVRSSSFVYMWDLSTNQYPPSSDYVMPTEQALQADSDTDNNHYGVWRARHFEHNRLYYNPTIQYEPWTGQDSGNAEFTNAIPTAIRLVPVDASNTFNMLATHSYDSSGVPEWDTNGGTAEVSVSVYIPHYYTSTATPPFAWNDQHTKVDIIPSVTTYVGGPNRDDCRVGDNNPLVCSYTQEIQNFANYFQYYRSREYVTKGGIGAVVSELQDIRVGYETVSNTTSEPIRPMNDLYTEGNKKTLMDNIYEVDSSGGTPLRQLLARAGKTFECSTGGSCPALPAPDGTCQQNFALLFTDGYWNGGTGVSTNADIDGTGPFDGGRYADSESQTLADVAMHYYETDLFSGVVDLVPLASRDILGAPTGTYDSDPYMHQHMKTYAIAFGVRGTINPASVPSDPTTAFTWPDPFSASQHKIDDLLHAATNGRGSFLSASNPVELKAAFEAAFLEFTQVASSTSAAAFNSTSLRNDTLLYRGFYDLRDNTGELTATIVNADGTLATTPTWQASERLDPIPPFNKTPATRKIVTFNPSSHNGIQFSHGSLTSNQQAVLDAGEVAFIRGDRTNEFPAGRGFRPRPLVGGLLGDIVNSSPVFVGAPRASNRDHSPFPTTDLYSDFAEATKSRPKMVYVGANDGMLHGFDAATGEEKFAYIPNKIIDISAGYKNNLEDSTSPFYLHKYYVDLTPRITDAYMRANTTTSSKSWNTILMGGLGAGGKGYFALNVNDPTSQFATESAAAGSVLWEFTDEDDTYPIDSLGVPLGGSVGAVTDPNGAPVKDLGYALTLPTVAISNVPDGSGEKEWVALFGNGPNSTAGIAKLFVLFMDAGLNGWSAGDFVKLSTGRGVPIAPAQKAGYPNGLGSVSAIDQDRNGSVDLVYAGDRLGNLYRFNIGDPDPANWSTTHLFSATYNDGTTDLVQPILSKPLVMKHPDQVGFIVVFGTGSFQAKDDASDQEIQSIYGIWDPVLGTSAPATAASDTKANRLVEQTMTNVVDDSGATPITRRILTDNAVNYQLESGSPGTYGWYIDLDMQRASSTLSGTANLDTSGNAPTATQFPGEKAVRRLIQRNGVILGTTVLPSTGESSCFGARPGALLLIDSVSGGNARRAIIDFNGDGTVDDADFLTIGSDAFAGGILFDQGTLDGSLVDLSTLGAPGATDFLFISGGNNTVAYDIEDVDESRTGRLSWQELEQ